MKSFEIKATIRMWIDANNKEEAIGIANSQLKPIFRKYSPHQLEMEISERTQEEIERHERHKEELRKISPNFHITGYDLKIDPITGRFV